jgi:hypothetical protein
LAVNEFHGIEVDAAFATDPVNRHNMGMFQRGRRPGLVLEALQMARVHQGRKRERLQGHTPGQGNFLGLVDNAHAAAANLAENAEIAQGPWSLPGKGPAPGQRGKTPQIDQGLEGRPQFLEGLRLLGVRRFQGFPVDHFPGQ